MSERCQAQTKNGKPCSATPRPGTTLCVWHTPKLAEARTRWRSNGGANSSNEARARKSLRGDLRDMTDVRARLMSALTKVEEGKIDPGVANAMANLGRAIIQVAGVTDFQDELTDLRRELAELREVRTGA